jgi:hypothetical protein
MSSEQLEDEMDGGDGVDLFFSRQRLIVVAKGEAGGEREPDALEPISAN